MTPDARDRAVAEAVVKAWHAEWLTSGALKGLPDEWVAALADRITAALATARAEEQEACAVEAEKFATLLEQAGPITVGMRTYDRMTWAKDIAAALRARGEG